MAFSLRSLQSGVRGTSAAARLLSIARPVSRRSLHVVPRLPNQSQYESQGIEGLYSPTGFRDVWTDYQQSLVDDLSRLTVETANETRTPFAIMLNTAGDQLEAATFNFASQAHNNHMFVQALRPEAQNNTKPSLQLRAAIERDFGSLEELKAEFLAVAESHYGNGWVFLVEGDNKSLYFQYSYAAGSPYFIGRSQVYDLNMAIDEAVEEELAAMKQDVDDKVRVFPMPLLAVNLWENAYITDFSVAGKSAYLEKVWNCLDWEVISNRFFSIK